MSDLKPGSKVLHPLFGAGTVRAVSGSGPDAKITVDFGSAVGQKKLIASVANLKSTESVDGEAAPAVANRWYEVYEGKADPRPGRRPVAERIHAALASAVRTPEFWATVRERLRAGGNVPRVLDDLSGNISVHFFSLLKARIVVRHSELVRPGDAVLARAIAATLTERYLSDFQPFSHTLNVGVQNALDEASLITIGDEPIENLPDRDPKRRPLPVTPKGVITSRPKRHDDY
jgi:hypothetical protein